MIELIEFNTNEKKSKDKVQKDHDDLSTYFFFLSLSLFPEFPDILPPPPSPRSALLGPTDFSISLEKLPCSDQTSDFICDIYSITSCSTASVTSKYATDHWLYSSSSASSSVSGTHSDILSFDDCGPVILKHDCEDLYPLKEVIDGKEVVTITTSNTAPTTSTLSVSMPVSLSQFSVPHQGIPTVSSRNIDERNCAPYILKSSEYNQTSNTGEDVICLLTPETFLSGSPCSVQSSHIPHETASELSLRDSCVHEKNDVSRQATAWASSQECLKPASTMPQVNYKSSNSKGYLNHLGVLKTSRKFANFQDNENISESVSYGQDMEMISNIDDTEQSLKNIAQSEEEEQKEAERHSQQKISLYDAGPLPPIGVFWDIENCQVCIL